MTKGLVSIKTPFGSRNEFEGKSFAMQMIVENPPASNAFHDTEEKKFVADILVLCFTCLALFCMLQWTNHLCFFIYVQKFLRKYKFKNMEYDHKAHSCVRPLEYERLRQRQERTQAEENNPDPIPMIVENAAASSDIPGIEEQKFVANTLAEIERPEIFGMSKRMTGDLIKRFKDRTCLEAGELREKQKDAISDIPDIDMKKFHVHGEMPLGKFVDFIRLQIELSIKKPIFVFFKNTEPPTGALMGAIDEENKGEDGFLHIPYSGEEKLCGSNEGQECP
ncbi:PREDICTED: autophagy-related [Prunus dulcis]|uniref:Autophagy-related protein n=1 Tax=Prunus dulcis TaxID=3755 RepID=A0A5E4FU45_PRUDU|nr:PREDICTED: autophagy-related [Prunus dulcis]